MASIQSLPYFALDLRYIEETEFARLYEIAEETASLIGGLTSYLRGGR